MRTHLSRRAGFTLIEIAVSLAVIAVAGGLLFSGIRTVALLGAKNSAVNLTHQQTRAMIHHAVSQLHLSVSIPSLADTTLSAVSGSGPSAAVTYQTVVTGPYRVWSSAAVGATSITVDAKAGNPAPVVGQRLIVPAFELEQDITGVSSLGGSPPLYSISFATGLTRSITCTSGSPSYVAYYTQRSALAVINKELRLYPRANAATYSVVARNISSATPFTVPADTRFIQANFAAQDPRVLGLNWKSMFTQMQITVPYRYRLTISQ